MFVFNSWPKKQHSLYEKSAGTLSQCKKMLGLGFILFDKAFSYCVNKVHKLTLTV
jgi:hypothetical protein